MKTFFNILQTLTNVKYKKYPDDSINILLENYNIRTEQQIYIWSLIYDIYNIEKYQKMPKKYRSNIRAYAKLMPFNNVINNIFYKKELKDQLIDIYSKAQKCYYAFTKLARIYKLNKYPIVVKDDLTLNPLNIKDKNTFVLIENKSIYLFRLNELISIIETAIGHAPNFFTAPLVPLNPYNNQPLTNATLYNIYFKMKDSTRVLSSIFHFFFKEQFILELFSEKYEYHIRERAIYNYVFTSPYTLLHNSVLNMLKNNIYTKMYNIHKDFPKDLLVSIFRPFLYCYYVINYSIKGTTIINTHIQWLNQNLQLFYCYNPSFGRQYIHTVKHFNKVIKQEYKFNTKHMTFYEINRCYSNMYVLPYLNNNISSDIDSDESSTIVPSDYESIDDNDY